MEYTQKYLKKFLHTERPLRVTNELSEKSHQVRISMDKHDRRAVISTNWGNVVKDAQLLYGEMVIFWFKEQGHDLRVNVCSGIPLR